VIKHAFVVAGESDIGQRGRKAALAKPRYPKIEIRVKHAPPSFTSLSFPTGFVTHSALTRVRQMSTGSPAGAPACLIEQQIEILQPGCATGTSAAPRQGTKVAQFSWGKNCQFCQGHDENLS
jgi:hypothetical protein